MHHDFLYVSLSSLHDYDLKWPNFKFFWGRERQGDKFYHLCLNSGAAPLFSSNINSLLFSNWSTWDNREMVWKHAESFFQRPVNGRRRCRIVRSLLLVLGPQRPYIPRILKPDLHILFTITGFFGPLQATVGHMTQERLSKLPIPPP